MLYLNEKCFRKLALFVILTCLTVYTYVYLDNLTDSWMYTKTKMRNAYFVNHRGCRMIALDVINPSIQKFLEDDHSPLKCRQSSWFHTKTYNGSWTLELNEDMEKIVENFKMHEASPIYCSYRPMRRFRTSDQRIKQGRKISFQLEPPYRVTMPKEVEFIKLVCQNHDNITLHVDIHFFIRPTPEDELKAGPKKLKKWVRAHEILEEPLISVMIIGLDSVSHLNFLRQMPRTRDFIRKKMSHVEFWGYNKMSLNTYSNLIPMLSGLPMDEFEELCFPNKTNESHFFDHLPFIWKLYKEAGYNTSFAEDETLMTLFNYLNKGFRSPPTDHYLRPVLKANDLHGATKSNLRSVDCAGGRTYGDLMMELIDKLVPHMQRYPFFSFYWWIQGVHDYFNFPRQVDERFENLLKRLSSSGITNNTFIFFMSDHGIRWGSFRRTYQGMLEDNQPMLFALYPGWMKQRYRLALKSLEHNAHSLVTVFDIYNTMLHLLQPRTLHDAEIKKQTAELWRLRDEKTPRGASLFLPLPPWRTCNSSHIPSTYCLCHKLTPAPNTDAMAQRAGRFLINSINERLKPHPECWQLQLETVVSAYYASLERELDNWSTRRQAELEVRVRLQAKPGGAFFEGTTRIQGYTLILIDEIIRVGDPNNNTYCIDDPQVEMFCHCLF